MASSLHQLMQQQELVTCMKTVPNVFPQIIVVFPAKMASSLMVNA